MSSEPLANLHRIGLLDKGYRTLTSKPGHHQTTLQCLIHTLGVAPAEIRVLDGLRKQRNLSDYDGEPVSQADAGRVHPAGPAPAGTGANPLAVNTEPDEEPRSMNLKILLLGKNGQLGWARSAGCRPHSTCQNI